MKPIRQLRHKTGMTKKDFAKFIDAKTDKRVTMLESKAYDTDPTINLLAKVALNCPAAYDYLEKRYIDKCMLKATKLSDYIVKIDKDDI